MRILEHVVLSIVAMTISLCAIAQNQVGEINRIKLSGEYIYAENTSAEWENAYNNASSILEKLVEDWIRENNSSIQVETIMNDIQHIKATRDDFFRAFVYVRKPSMPQVEDVAETPSEKQAAPAPTMIDERTPEENRMLDVRQSNQIEAYIYTLRRRDRLVDYGKYSTLPEGPFYAFVYNRKGEITAVIRNDINGQTNIATGQNDDITNYSGCGARWFRIKDN